MTHPTAHTTEPPRCVACGSVPPRTAGGRIFTVSAGNGVEPACDPDCAEARAETLGAASWVTGFFPPIDLL